MRGILWLAALMAVGIAGAANAQAWGEYVSQEDRFGINFPGEPAITEAEYALASGLRFPAKTYRASDGAGDYSLIAVNFAGVSDDMRDGLIEDAANVVRARGGEITYDEVAVYDGMDTRMMQVTNEDGSKSYIAILQPPEPSRVDRLYIAEGRVGANMPVPGHFQQSLFVVDPNGERIRYQTDIEGTKFRVIPNTGGEPYLAPECAPGLPCLLIGDGNAAQN